MKLLNSPMPLAAHSIFEAMTITSLLNNEFGEQLVFSKMLHIVAGGWVGTVGC